MAEALCGPSNALQDFKRATQVDRTLQQDRLVARQNPIQGFRSAGANPGLLDPEFEAFQAGHAVVPQSPFEGRAFSPHAAPHFAVRQQSSPFPDWASDFQRLNIASPQQPASPFVSAAPSIAQQQAFGQPSQASWHQDFMQSQHTDSLQQPQFMNSAFQNNSWDYGHASPFTSISQGKQMAVERQESHFDAQAFEAAFDAATHDALAADDDLLAQEIADERDEIEYLIAKKEAEEIAKLEASQTSNHLTGLDLAQDFDLDQDQQAEWPDQLIAEDGNLQHEQLSQDPIHDHPREQEVENKDAEHQRMVDEQLARTAGQLLENVSHETSQKFQESVFLQLMRRIRDKEMTVDGDNFVETGSNSGASTPALGAREPIVSSPTANRVTSDTPLAQDDSDLGRFGEEPDVPPMRLPARPLTPDIDPPAPSFADWRQRLWNNLE